MAGARRGPGPGRRPFGGPTKGRKPASGKPAKPANSKPANSKPAVRPTAGAPAGPPPAETFTLGAIPGATPGKWIDIWNERMPQTRLILEPIEVAGQRAAIADVDAALVRLPIDSTGLHVIRLYDEVTVVVMPADSHLTAADELDVADLAGEVLIVPRDDVIGLAVPGTVAPDFAAPETTEDAIATVAAGVGIVLVPMSLARLHHRKDADHRPLRGAPVSTVALAWDAERTTPEVETFVGIVRGRTGNSSR
ncbi:MAG TPA: LysR family substrate-binding domain-containing protein [Microbacterium sp.]|uniref:LysR family substrate-binding domain-containing protein n=1 Tax=Microbacterium sp. TaxID=51671 RepID=UPI002B484C19|nr:LysR family substrate-binding domain-containing protein [Microbacterium sp.]HKT58292.1 LysR family substrate-binding domain-containing protein [Microbacterium sp.]